MIGAGPWIQVPPEAGGAVRNLILKMSVSVDGFVGGPNGELDWIFKSLDKDATAWTMENVWRAGVHIMGSRTFRDMAAHWPFSTEVFAAPMNEIPKVVFSTGKFVNPAGTSTPAEASWAGARVARGDLAGEIGRLKQEPGKEIMAHGGAGFARSLVRLGLVDEYRLLIHPVALGSGLGLFSSLAKPIDLKLISTSAFPGGAIAKIYRPG
jgi:dihydrofolate reductase